MSSSHMLRKTINESPLLMMDAGEIVFDLSANEKAGLTMNDIIEKFHKIKNKSFTTDRVLLH